MTAVVRAEAELPPGRWGIGPAGSALELPESARQARLALALTARGDPSDPGPQVLRADDLGALLVLAEAVDRDPALADIADVRAIDGATTHLPWALVTLDGIVGSASLRTAAALLHLHHSSLQHRLVQLATALGWDPSTPGGRLRTQQALALRRLGRRD